MAKKSIRIFCLCRSCRSHFLEFSRQNEQLISAITHGVAKSQKKSHLTLRANRATFTFQADKSSLKMPKIVNFGDILQALSFVKQRYQVGQF